MLKYLIILLVGCQEVAPQTLTETGPETSVKKTAPEQEDSEDSFLGIKESEDELEACNEQKKDKTVYTKKEAIFFYCDGEEWTTIDTKGEKGDSGKDGKDGLKGDKGDQGLSGKDGIDGTNGAKGDKGDQGIAGISGAKGDKGDTGTNGQNGTNGSNGVGIATAARNATVTECSTGGKALDTWYDHDNNGIYDAGVDSGFRSVYACNGAATAATVTEYTQSNQLTADLQCQLIAVTAEGWNIYVTWDDANNIGLRISIIDNTTRLSDAAHISACDPNAWAWTKSIQYIKAYQWTNINPTARIYWKPTTGNDYKIMVYN